MWVVKSLLLHLHLKVRVGRSCTPLRAKWPRRQRPWHNFLCGASQRIPIFSVGASQTIPFFRLVPPKEFHFLGWCLPKNSIFSAGASRRIPFSRLVPPEEFHFLVLPLHCDSVVLAERWAWSIGLVLDVRLLSRQGDIILRLLLRYEWFVFHGILISFIIYIILFYVIVSFYRFVFY